MRARATATAAAFAAIAVLSGCVDIQQTGVSQVGGIGGVIRATVVVCASDPADAPAQRQCGATTNAGAANLATGNGRLLLGFKVPAGTRAPEEVNASAGEPLAFERSDSYEQELTRLVPPPAGLQWVGYMSAPYAHIKAEPARSTTVSVVFELPRPADGGPFGSPFTVRAVAGGRQDLTEAPVACGASAYELAGGTICVDSPSPALTQTDGLQTATLDAGVVTGSATASPGQTVIMPFDVRIDGNLAATSVPATATTTLPGGRAVALTPSVGVGPNVSARAPVQVAVPSNAGPGVFDVGLSVQFENGLIRAGTAKLTIRDRRRPVVSRLSVKPKRFRPRRRGRGARVSLRLNEDARVRFTVQRCVRRNLRGRCTRYRSLRGAFTRSLKAGRNSFRFKGYVRKRRLRAGRYRFSVRATDAASNRSRVRRAGFAVRR